MKILDSKKSDFSNYQPSDDELKESMSIIIDILNKTKSTILSICVKEDSFLAKKYSRTPYHLVELITGIDDEGIITTQQERVEVL